MSEQVNAVAAAKQALNEVAQFNTDGLVQLDRLGSDAAFTELKEMFDSVFKTVSTIQNEIELENIPAPVLRQLERECKQIFNELRVIANFNPKNSERQERQGIVGRFPEKVEPFIKSASYVISLRYLNKNASPTPEEIIQEIIEPLQIKSRDAIGLLDGVLAAVGKKAEKAGISKYSEIFENEATIHLRWSYAWLIIIIAEVAGTIYYAIRQIESLPTMDLSLLNHNNYIFLLLLSKGVIVTAIFYAISFSIRTYKSHKHNQVVNRHRHNALTTFETFSTAAASDKTTMNAVLLEATRSIFAGQSTGYLGPNDPSSDISSRIVEIIKGDKADN